MSRASHALVVGGTGMLRDVSLELVRRGFEVSVVERRTERLARLRQEAGPRLHPVPVDYRDTGALSEALERQVAQLGPIVLAVVWVHSVAPEAPYVIARYVQGRYFHVLGSATADPSRPDPGRSRRFAALPHLRYREVILGFVVEPGGSRWLTHDEISRGVLEAIDRDAPRGIVGTVEPWSARA